MFGISSLFRIPMETGQVIANKLKKKHLFIKKKREDECSLLFFVPELVFFI
ncbi:conserved hypothetical protein [Listeria monocytogenes QOC1]|nr:conserved hypothetical protein [Listeria monocytogenes QOC1]CUL84006.1 hypothetical protein LM83088_260010 [Listeria monocytogenes]